MRAAVAFLVLATTFAGCLGQDASVEEDGEAPPEANLWQRGLAQTYETPPHVRTRMAQDRLAEVAAPGDPRFAHFDAAMTAFMDEEAVAAGQLAVMQEGRLLYISGYGNTKPDGSAPTDAQTMFRLASVTKPMTHALISLQVEQGLYEWTDPVFCLPPDPAPDCRIPLSPHPNHPVVDDRIAGITVEDLLAHQGGWGRTTDYLYRAEGTEKIREALRTSDVPSRWQGAQYLMGIELADDPGTVYAYCNVCYMLASLVAEAATGASIGALFEAYLFRPLEVSGDIELGKAFPADRNPREPFYETDYERPSAYDPAQMVPGADGGFNIEMLAATGGLVATASAVAAVYETYPESVPLTRVLRVDDLGPYDLTHEHRGHGGLLDGTLTGSHWVAGKVGAEGPIQFVFLFNNGAPSSSCDYDLPVLGDDLGGCAVLALQTALFNLAAAKANESVLL